MATSTIWRRQGWPTRYEAPAKPIAFPASTGRAMVIPRIEVSANGRVYIVLHPVQWFSADGTMNHRGRPRVLCPERTRGSVRKRIGNCSGFNVAPSRLGEVLIGPKGGRFSPLAETEQFSPP